MKQQIAEAKAREKKMQEENSAIKSEIEALSNVIAKAVSANKEAAAMLSTEKPSYQIAGEPSCGMTVVREGLLYGFINSRNEYVIKAQYEEVYEFGRGFAQVKKNGKWGLIDTTGKTIIPCSYDELDRWAGADYSIWIV